MANSADRSVELSTRGCSVSGSDSGSLTTAGSDSGSAATSGFGSDSAAIFGFDSGSAQSLQPDLLHLSRASPSSVNISVIDRLSCSC